MVHVIIQELAHSSTVVYCSVVRRSVPCPQWYPCNDQPAVFIKSGDGTVPETNGTFVQPGSVSRTPASSQHLQETISVPK